MPRLRRPRTHTPHDPGITPDSAPSVRPGDTVCGYRIVRKLGGSTRADVYLGFSESTLDAAHPSTAAIKIYRPAVSPPSIATELETLGRAAHPHVVRFSDVATTASGSPCVVLERLARGSLAHLLELRPTLSPGEIVTILTPIAAAVDALHASGVAHGAIGAGSVLFRESGAPVLARFGRSSLFAPGQSDAALAKQEAVLADRSALADLTRLVLARTGSSVAVPDVESDRFGETLATRLFEMAPATAVRFAVDAEPVASAVPARVGARAAVAPPSEGDHGVLTRARAIGSTVIAQARTVRRPVWVVAASVVIALVAAIALVPGEHPQADAVVQPSSTPVTEVAVSDDPLDALPALLAARDQCIASASVLCLDAVDQQGSQGFDADAALVSGIQNGGEVPDDAAIASNEPALVERLGDTALIALGGETKPASVLLVKTEAGWRIRDYLD